jgi:O-antigen ligase
MIRLPPLLPPLALALLAAWCGTLWGGATAAGGAVSLALWLVLLGTLGAPWRDPLRLGTAGRLLPQLVWIWAALTWWASPVRRAGTAGLVLLPLFLLLPAVVARCWRDEASRRQGLRALAIVVAGAAAWALVDRRLTGAPRAAMPLGHHNLLATFLVTVLPLAVLPLRERRPWRIVGGLAGTLGIAAVLASGSLLGAAALVLEGFVVLVPSRHRRTGWAALLLLVGLAAAVLAGPRLARIAAGEDSSAQARAVYWQAGWQGFLARPLIGWGPGAAAWTNARYLQPRPGVNPPGEAVGELHSLPLQIAYEQGVIGLLLALGLAWVFAVRRAREVRQAADPALLLASLAGLAGAAAAFLGTAALDVAALPWAVAIAAGGCLAAAPEPAADPERAGRAFAVAAALALAPWTLAHGLYDRALAAEIDGRRPQALADLGRAIEVDPGLPLYRMRWALLVNDPEAALKAAQDGRAVAALWTVAGVLGQAAGKPWATGALQSACELDPLDPLPPFFQMQAAPESPGAARSGAHALLAEPRLAAAFFWEGRRPLLDAALEEVRLWPGVDAGWKESFLAAARRSAAPGGEREWLALTLDTDPRESVSVLLFRRRPWPTQWPVIPLHRSLLPALDLPPATTLATTARTVFAPKVCVPTTSHAGHRSVTWQPSAQPLSGGARP